MKVQAWRIVQSQYAQSAFDGEGARAFGGRWNSRGTAIVYTSRSAALAALEMLVHLEPAELLQSYRLIEVRFDASLVMPLDLKRLPALWRSDPSPRELRRIGDAWARSEASVVLRVPSVVIATEWNYLLNPGHSDFRRIEVGKPRSFAFDPRLLRQ